MAKQAEEEINIKSRARRRLVGAIVLALAVVVVLPMLLDSEPKITGQDIDLRIPAPDKVGEFVPGEALSKVVDAAARSAVVANPVSGVAPAVKPAVSETVQPLKEPVKEPEVKLAQAKPAEVRQAEAKPAEARHAEVKPSEKPSEKPSGNYIVQIGAFSSGKTAEQEAARLKAWGFKAYTELISGTTRVRVGPYVDRSKADEVRQLLEKHGLHPVIAEVNGHGK